MEIKEILDDLDYAKNKERGTITLNQKDINLLLDYITNLQLEKEDYKSRCEKAVEIINEYELIVGYYDYADEDGYWDTDSNNNLQEELKDTLNGRSDK